MLVEGIEGGRLSVGEALEPIDAGEDRAAAVDSRHLHVERRGDVADGELLGIGIGMDLERTVGQTEDPRHAAVVGAIDVGPELDERGEGRLEAVLVGDNRSDTGVDERRIDVPPRHAPVVGDAVAGVAGIPAAEERVAAQFPGHPPAELGEEHPRHRRRDRIQGAADSVGGLRLGVEGVVVARSPLRPDEDAGDVAGGMARVRQQPGRPEGPGDR